jgi:hypothetical protein
VFALGSAAPCARLAVSTASLAIAIAVGHVQTKEAWSSAESWRSSRRRR